MPRSQPRSLALLSAHPDEGKTLTTLLLAQMAERADDLAIVVDLDLRRDSLAREFRLPPGPGTAELLRGEARLSQAIRAGAHLGFDVITAGDGVAAADDLRAETLGQILSELKATYDLVLVNCPALLPVPDAVVIAQAVDQRVLIVRHDHTPRTAVARALSMLATYGVRLDGLVLGRADPEELPDGYVYGYGYGRTA